MSVSIQTVEFERREAHLSSLEEQEPPYTVHGVALGAGDVTVGQSGIKKLWPAEELEKAAETLKGTNLVEDHNNGSRGVVGKVTKAGYKEGVGVLYEAELYDEDLAENINNGLLEVSIRGYHIDVEEMEEDEESGAKIVEGIQFDNLSIVPTGAAPSNSIEMGEADELSLAELAAFTEELQEEEEFEAVAGEYVQWGDDNHGIILSMPEDGEVEVDLYEDDGGTWRAVGETEMVSVDSLDPWDVDEDDIGAMAEDEENDEEEAQEIPDKYFFESEEEAEAFIEDKDGLTGVHEMDDGWMPGADHEEFTEWFEANAEEEMQFSSRHEAMDAAYGIGLKSVHLSGDYWMPGVDEDEFAERMAELGPGVTRRGEGEEEPGNKDAIIEQSPERFPDGKTADGDNEEASADEGDEESDVEELQDYEMHTPDWSGTTESEWSSPDLEDFDTDDLSEVDDHFLISASGFPPENYGDLKLPVVEPNGDLNVNALAAVKGGRGVSAVDGLSDEMEEKIVNWVNKTANEEFDKDWGTDEEEAAGRRPRTIDDTGHESNVENAGPVDLALDFINKYLRIEGNHERDSVDNMLSWLFGNTDIPSQSISDSRTAANAFLNDTPGTDTFAGMTVEQFRDWLLMHGDGSKGRREQRQRGEEVDRGDGLPPGEVVPVHVLTGDDLQQMYDESGESELDNTTTNVINMTEDIEEKLAELDEPVAVEKSELEDLQGKADQFEELNSNLEDLRERTEILDSVDREQVEELAESDEPVVVESTRYEALSAEAEQVKNVYAAALAEAYDVFDAEELTDRFSIEELREKYEENIGDPEEELAAEPRSGDPDEEELEEQAEAEAEEELSSEEEEAAEKRAELREKILGGN